MTAASDKLAGTCSVCLRPMQLRGDKPIRHGFSAIGVRHGANSGYHTGPCTGYGFPHLGISTEGTVWAIGRAKERLGAVKERLAELATRPNLTWYPRLSGSYNKVRGGLPDMSKPVTLSPNQDVSYAGDGRPTYERELQRKTAEQIAIKDELDRAITEYDRVLSTWTPEKYAAVGAPAKIETVHMEMPRTHTRYGTWKGITCRFTRAGHASDKLVKTADVAKITCKACKKALGLPA